MSDKVVFLCSQSIKCADNAALTLYLMNNENRDDIGKKHHKYNTYAKSRKLVHKHIARCTCDTDYYVTIAEKDKNGYHKALEPVVVHTGKLSELGDILKIDKTSADSVTLKWDSFGLPIDSGKNGDISITYSIQVSSLDKDDIVKDVKETVYTVSGLTPLTKYTFKLTAKVTIGDKTFETKPSKAVEVITLPSAVTGLTASAKDGNSISVKWDKLKDTLSDGAKVTYQLYGSDKKDGEYTALFDNLSETAYTETKLKTGTTRFYYVTVTVAFGENEKVVSEKCETVSAKAEIKQSVGNSADRNTGNKNNNQNTYTPTKKYKNQPGNATPELNAQARVIAQKIANEIKADASLDTDLKKVTRAAQRVAEYAGKYADTPWRAITMPPHTVCL